MLFSKSLTKLNSIIHKIESGDCDVSDRKPTCSPPPAAAITATAEDSTNNKMDSGCESAASSSSSSSLCATASNASSAAANMSRSGHDTDKLEPANNFDISHTHDAPDDVPGIGRQWSAPLGYKSPEPLTISFGETPTRIIENDKYKDLSYESGVMLVILDMDHTIVGDLESLSDRDNVETNVPWEYWQPGVPRGLSTSDIIPFMQRGMLRPAVLDFIIKVRQVGATIVIYTHSEDKWARKVVQAIEEHAGFPFVHKVLSRLDCKDGNPLFSTRKSLRYAMSRVPGEWTLQKVVFLDDDANAVNSEEAARLVVVPSYDYWEPCQWDINLTPEVLRRNPRDLVDKLIAAVTGWGIASPCFGKEKKSEDDLKAENRWVATQKKKEEIRLVFNKVLQKDSVFKKLTDVLDECLSRDHPIVGELPKAMRHVLGTAQDNTPMGGISRIKSTQ